MWVGPLTPGTYKFYNDFHPQSTGTLVVVAPRRRPALASKPCAARRQRRAHLRPSRSAQWMRGIERFVDRHRNKLAWIHVAMFFGFMVLMTVPLLLPLPPDGATLL